jgi:hypothetical protein
MVGKTKVGEEVRADDVDLDVGHHNAVGEVTAQAHIGAEEDSSVGEDGVICHLVVIIHTLFTPWNELACGHSKVQAFVDKESAGGVVVAGVCRADISCPQQLLLQFSCGQKDR